MRWIKAIERIPEDVNKKYYCRCYNEGTKKVAKKIVFFSADRVFESSLRVIEWLDETESPSDSEAVELVSVKFYNHPDEYVMIRKNGKHERYSIEVKLI